MRKRRKQAESEAPPLEARRITPVEIQQKEFRLAVRGYNERDVDQFLDEVTEEVARLYADNKRLREEVEFSRTTRLSTTDSAEAEGILRRAREEAARIIAEAQARASTLGASDSAGPPGGAMAASGPPQTEGMGIFLARERAFLQNMANLIQTHAEGVKQDVRRVRERVDRQVPPAPAPTDAVTVDADPEAEPAPEAPPSQPDADEPTQAWRTAAAESQAEQDSPEPASQVVDLTNGREEGAEQTSSSRVPEPWSSSTAPGHASEPWSPQSAMSRTYGRDRAGFETGPTPRAPGEGRPPADSSNRAEEEDAREDRTLRELFWGED
jgi:cell division initiation protein